MRTFLIAFLSCLIGISTAEAYNNIDDMLARKRAEAERQRMQAMQAIQHRRANPEAFLLRSEDRAVTETFEASTNGHFYIPAMLNGRKVNFIADTGATDIFLTQDDARNAGINFSSLNYNILYNTANGQVRAAETFIDELSIGNIRVPNVKVSVSQNSGGMSLLGMSFFNRLSKYEVSQGKLTLHK